ncbi:9041_t:CDS:2 [Paraglomus brasilianum]|uniref:9041_t:CDS:1 n=1 Tax=Paraglomus brasilianum TaxID=144538 RepID=A0A9N9BTM3_9GLOM|nr:9041_t:CDS:2 [Paraglomus brasilianum]
MTVTRSRGASTSSQPMVRSNSNVTITGGETRNRMQLTVVSNAMSDISDTGSVVSPSRQRKDDISSSSSANADKQSNSSADKQSNSSTAKRRQSVLADSKTVAKPASPKTMNEARKPSGRTAPTVSRLNSAPTKGSPGQISGARLHRKSSMPSTGKAINAIAAHRGISPTPSSASVATDDMDLADMDIEKFEKLFLQKPLSNRSPSILSNYSAYVPWKAGVPIDPEDSISVREEMMAVYNRGMNPSITLTDYFAEPDEQLQAGLTLIQEAYSKKFASLTRALDEERRHRNPGNDQVSQYQQRIRELNSTLAKEEDEKKQLLIAKNSLQDRYNKLWEEHRHCDNKNISKSAGGDMGTSIVPILTKGRLEIRNYLKTLEASERLALLDEFLDCCHPHDIHMQQAMLDHYVKTTFDIIGTLPSELGVKIFSLLTAEDLCRSRTVSKCWRKMVNEPDLWKKKCLDATIEDPEPLVYPSDSAKWEVIYRGLHYREHNWAMGNVQSIKFLKGHTASVTALKLKKSTLVTGSSDETVRVWDVRTGKCTKVLQGKGVSCLDFLPKRRIVTAGFSDQGRALVWHMDTGEVICTLQGHNRGVKYISMSDKHVATAGHDMSICIWNWRDGSKLATFRGIGQMILGCALVGDNNMISISIDGWIRTFAIEEKQEVHKWRLPENAPIQWFNASGMDLTCATPRNIWQLRWQNKYVKTGKKTPKGEDEVIIQPDFAADPIVKQKIASIAEAWCGATDNKKGRVVISTRFNSRTHNNKSIYVHSAEKGMQRFGGLWMRMAEQMATISMGPTCMDVDHEKVIVGSAGGSVYVMGFVGDKE